MSSPSQPTVPLRASRDRALAHIVATAVLLGAILLVVRAKTVGFWLIPTLLDWRGQLPVALITACYDVLFVLSFSLAAVAALFVPWVRDKVRPRWVERAHRAFACFTLFASLANIGVVAWLGQPFTFQWLYYSDFMRSIDSMMAVAEAIDGWQVALVAAAVVIFFFVSRRWGRWLEEPWADSRRVRGAAVVLAGGLAVFVAYGHSWLRAHHWGPAVVRNPVWAFAESCVRTMRTPEIFKMLTPVQPDDFVAPPTVEGRPASVLPADRAVPRNVIYVVLESVSARYVGLYGGEHGVTPELDRRRGQAAIFQNAYAPAPATNMTLLSLFSGVYPQVSFRLSIAEHPDAPLPNLASQFAALGHATSFFGSAPLDFQRADAFLEAQGRFDLIEDSTGRSELAGTTPPWPAAAGTSDASTVESLIQWIEGCGAQPFFTTLWTMQTHFPYYVVGEERAIVEDVQFNRYLNALAETDRALGRLLTWLETSGRADDTLVVVLGDHGEAFGQHKNFGHAGHLFEENIHIPLVLLQPRLFSGRLYDTNCSVVDLAPTLADVLRFPADPAWHGRSLFSTQRTGRAYFFAAWSDFLLGYREGNTKRMFNAVTGDHITYDLATDPDEKIDLARDIDASVHRETSQRIAAWVQHVERNFARP